MCFVGDFLFVIFKGMKSVLHCMEDDVLNLEWKREETTYDGQTD